MQSSTGQPPDLPPHTRTVSRPAATGSKHGLHGTIYLHVAWFQFAFYLRFSATRSTASPHSTTPLGLPAV
ncbi:hypothetical protein AERO8C_170118 [Aeromonas veronii]|uniref:Uncharacterized protein n=1 Tax=Aeromonas veronii TaxID=654 RepID=A0A653L052_AERVE|nr:hypothetical protein AERO8C_170118 [Aeromonas veronii]